MKTTKKIFSFFNLLLFVGSFCFTSLSGFASTPQVQNPNHLQKQFVSKQDVEDGGCSQWLFEKNENENENENESESDLQLQSLLLPFLVSFFQLELSQSSFISLQPLAVSPTNPIYLSVCNFRV